LLEAAEAKVNCDKIAVARVKVSIGARSHVHKVVS